jgi:hypothetical protein
MNIMDVPYNKQFRPLACHEVNSLCYNTKQHMLNSMPKEHKSSYNNIRQMFLTNMSVKNLIIYRVPVWSNVSKWIWQQTPTEGEDFTTHFKFICHTVNDTWNSLFHINI